VKRFFLAGLFLFLWVTIALGQVIYTANPNFVITWTDYWVPKSQAYEITLVREVTGERFIFNCSCEKLCIEIHPRARDINGKDLKSGIYEVQVVSISQEGWRSPMFSSLGLTARLQDSNQLGSWKVFYKPEAPGAPHFNP